MLKKIVGFFATIFFIKCSSLPVNETSIGPEIMPQSPSICKLFETADKYMNQLRCKNNYYSVELIDFPNKNFTERTFCPPSPQFSIAYYNKIGPAIVCKQKHISSTTTFKLYCKEILIKDIVCEEIYIDSGEMNNNNIIIGPSQTTIPFSTTTFSDALTSKKSEMPVATYKTKHFIQVNEECNHWRCGFFILLAFFIPAFTALCFYFKFEKERYMRKQNSRELKKLLAAKNSGYNNGNEYV